MIDIENEIFADIASAVEAQMPKASLSSEYVKAPPKFPHASIVEVDNVALLRTRSNSSNENHATVTYEVNVYSNKKAGKKTECRKLFEIIDNRFIQMGFTRMMMNVIPDLYDATIYRMVGRYQAVVSRNHTIYRG